MCSNITETDRAHRINYGLRLVCRKAPDRVKGDSDPHFYQPFLQGVTVFKE